MTVIIDLSPVRAKTGPARLLDMVEGRSKHVLTTWLQRQTQAWRDRVEVVAMDGFTGFKTASEAELPDAALVLDPFHVVKLAGDALDACRQRVQQETTGHRGRSGDPLYGARRALRTSEQYLTNRQRDRISDVFANLEHAEVEATWSISQRVITAYREPKRALGKQALQAVIDALKTNIPTGLAELRKLGSTLNRRADDVLAYSDHPGTSN